MIYAAPHAGSAQAPREGPALIPPDAPKDSARAEAVPGAPEEQNGVGALYDPLEPCECAKCAKRLYQDGSADPGVSFKAPAHIAPEVSRATVASHEAEHVARNRHEAERLNLKVTSSAVRLFQRVCPECGTIYTSGGVTVTKYRLDVPAYVLLGQNVDKSL